MADRIKLGDTARDTITGFDGVVVCVSHYLHGCERLSLQRRGLTDEGRPHKWSTFDEPQLELVKDVTAEPSTDDTGGPRPEPAMRAAPSREN